VANINAPFGFRQYSGTGSAPTFEQVQYNMVYNASATYFGDPVTLQSDGTVAQSASTGATPGTLGIAGIFVGCKYLSVAQKRTVWSNYWPGSDVASGNFVTAYVVNDPNAKFVAQTDSTGAALVDVNGTVGFAIGTGSTANGISGAYVDMTTLNTASYIANNPFKIVGIINDPPGVQGTLSSGQAYDWVVVSFNNENTRNLQGV
jgi:hypothetical protein